MTRINHKTTAILAAILLALLATGKPAKATFPAKNGKIVFASVGKGKDALYMARPDGSNVTMVPGSTSSDAEPVFSPDGKKIAFSTNRYNNWEVWRVGASDGANPTNLTNAPGNDTQPTWQPLP